MTVRVTQQEVEAVWAVTVKLVDDLGLLPEGDRVVLCKGDAYVLWQTALIHAGESGHSDPRDAGLPKYLGDSKREVAAMLRGVNAALFAASRRQREIIEETAKRLEGPLL